jgi:hypothetical protein
MTVVEGRKLLVIKPTIIRGIGCVCIIFALICAIGAGRAGAWRAVWVFVFFAGLGAYLLLAPGRLEMNSEIIRSRTFWARYQIRWDEITRLELDRIGSSIVFWGENKRLVAVGPYYWQGPDRRSMMLLIAEQIDKLGLTVQQSERAMFRRSKNTKVRP